jgi:hypothetical protein
MEGRAVPAAHVHDDWERTRVEYSVIRYNLEFGPLMDKRKIVWAECWNRIKEYQSELELYHRNKENPIARQGYKNAMKQLKDLILEEKELSAVARACFQSCGDERVTHILR